MLTTDHNVIRFPVERAIGRDVARKRIGSLKTFGIPENINHDVSKWLESFLLKRFVLSGWTPINQGLIPAFKDGMVKHIIVVVGDFSLGDRPRVEIACKTMEECQIYNWKTGEDLVVVTNPVSLLAIDQSSYFRPCDRCLERSRLANVTDADY